MELGNEVYGYIEQAYIVYICGLGHPEALGSYQRIDAVFNWMNKSCIAIFFPLTLLGEVAQALWYDECKYSVVFFFFCFTLDPFSEKVKKIKNKKSFIEFNIYLFIYF